MPGTNARKHKIPLGTELSVNRATIFQEFGESIRDIVPVANVTERSQLVADLTAAGEGPTTARPLYVYRVDAPGLHRIECTVNGTVWVPASGTLSFASASAASSFATSNGGLLTVGDQALIGGLPYKWSGTSWVPLQGSLAKFARPTTSDSAVSSGTYIGLTEGTITDAPPGRYLIVAAASVYATSGSAVVGRVYAEWQGSGALARAERRWDLPNLGTASPVSATVSEFIIHTGGNLRIAVGYRRDSGTFAVTGLPNGESSVQVCYLGPA